jgi:hypothetical protein
VTAVHRRIHRKCISGGCRARIEGAPGAAAGRLPGHGSHARALADGFR